MRPKKYKGGGRRSLYDMMKKGGMLKKRADRREARGMKLDQKAFDLRTGARDKKDRLIGRANRNYDRMRQLREKSYMMALGGLVKKYQNGGVEGDPPMTAEQVRAMRNNLLVGSVDETPQAEDFATAGQGSSTSVAMPTRGPGEPLEPIRDPEPVPVRDPEPREDLEPLTPLGMRTVKRDDKKELQKPTESPTPPPPRRGKVQFETTRSGTNQFLKTGQIPISVAVYDEESKRFRMHPATSESIAKYIMDNQSKFNKRFNTFEEAFDYVEQQKSRGNLSRYETGLPEMDIYDFTDSEGRI